MDHGACFVSSTTGVSSSDRAAGVGDRPSVIIRSSAAEVVLSKEGKRVVQRLAGSGMSLICPVWGGGGTRIAPPGDIFD